MTDFIVCFLVASQTFVLMCCVALMWYYRQTCDKAIKASWEARKKEDEWLMGMARKRLEMAFAVAAEGKVSDQRIDAALMRVMSGKMAKNPDPNGSQMSPAGRVARDQGILAGLRTQKTSKPSTSIFPQSNE